MTEKSMVSADKTADTNQLVIEDIDKPKKTSSALKYTLNKAYGAVFSLLMVVVLGFFSFRILPGDPVKIITDGRRVDPEQLENIREQYGLNDPLIVQFWNYLVDLVTGDLGVSFVYRVPVTELMAERIGPTLLLSGTAALLSIVVGLWIGQKSAWKRGSFYDKANTGVALVLWSVPTFWLGLIVIMFFVGRLKLFPTGGFKTPHSDYEGITLVLDVLWHLTLPAVTMAAVVYAHYLMVMRASLLEEMSSDYLTTARAKGLREDDVRKKHAVPNALLPTITLIFMALGGLISGAVTVETVFSWPGLGLLTFEALKAQDYPVLQGTFVVFSAVVIIMNFFADLLYRVLDPRIR